MKEIIIMTREEAGVSYEAIYELVKDSYRQWSDNGLDGEWLHYPFEKFKKILSHAKVDVAINSKTGELLGTRTHQINRGKKAIFDCYLAVAPKAKRMGIATRILEAEIDWARKSGFEYLCCTTATTANWSVCWHLKNGYRIVGYGRSENNNHATYRFRLQLQPSLFWSGPLAPIIARLNFLLSYVISTLTKDSKGHLNVFGRLAMKILRRSE